MTQTATPAAPQADAKPQEPTAEFLAELAEQSARLETATPEEIIAWAHERYGDGLTMATAFGPEGCLILSMLAAIAPQTYVFNLDTGYQLEGGHTVAGRFCRRVNTLGHADFDRLSSGIGISQAVLKVVIGIGPGCAVVCTSRIGINENCHCLTGSGKQQTNPKKGGRFHGLILLSLTKSLKATQL